MKLAKSIYEKVVIIGPKVEKQKALEFCESRDYEVTSYKLTSSDKSSFKMTAERRLIGGRSEKV